MRTETAERMLEQGRQILEEEKNGMQPDPSRVQWAKAILTANALWAKKEPANA